MQSASKTMYTIGKVFNIIGIVLAGICTLVGIIMLGAGATVPVSVNGGEYEGGAIAFAFSGTFLLVFGLIYLAITITVLIFANNANKSLDNGKTDNGPHIIMIVIGVLSGDVFYLLGGVFGIISENI